jgi:GntR family transcriptional repressor for pyruvate dehydrogenase complex
MDALWTPVKESGSLTDRIVARIDELITTRELDVGARLPSEREMARLLGVSRPALRESVKTLEARGKLVVRHGQGVFVAQSASDMMHSELANLEVSLAELFAMREVLEAPAAAWAASSATDDELAELGELLAHEEPERRSSSPDLAKLAKFDSAFHLTIVKLAKNRFLERTLGILQEMLVAGMATTLALPARVEVSGREHHELFAAIRSRDPEAARTAAIEHIHGARDAGLERVRQQSAKLGAGRGRKGSGTQRGITLTGPHGQSNEERAGRTKLL